MVFLVEFIHDIIDKDPWENWILGDILIASACQAIQKHQVIEIGNFVIEPFF